MAGKAHILEDKSTISRFDRALFRVEGTLTLAGGITVFALMLLAVAQILGRKLFNLPVTGFIDWVEQAMAIFAFLGIAYCQRLGGHIRMDIVIGSLKGRALWLAEFLSTLVMMVITLVILYGAYGHFHRALELGDSSIDISLPLWPAKLMVPLALSILALRLAIHLWGYGRAFVKGLDQPIAVPLIETADEQARRVVSMLSLGGEGGRDERL